LIFNDLTPFIFANQFCLSIIPSDSNYKNNTYQLKVGIIPKEIGVFELFCPYKGSGKIAGKDKCEAGAETRQSFDVPNAHKYLRDIFLGIGANYEEGVTYNFAVVSK
jgi:hypothetical protein